MAYVMIVDDDVDFSGAVARVVKSTGHEVAVLYDTKSAANSIAQRRPDLIILDVMFPENDSEGFNFARQLNTASAPGAKIPVLMLTAVNEKAPLGFSEKDIDDAWLPVEDFVEKPVDIDVLRNKVVRMLDKAKK